MAKNKARPASGSGGRVQTSTGSPAGMSVNRPQSHGGTRPQPQAKSPSSTAADKPATLKDLLSAEVLGKLKAQASDLKAAEEARKEAERRQAEEARKAEQKRLDNDFGHLLANSKMDWRTYK